MVHTELFGKKSRTFQGLKSFFQGLVFPSPAHLCCWYTTQLSIAIQHTGNSFLHQHIPLKRLRASSCLNYFPVLRVLNLTKKMQKNPNAAPNPTTSSPLKPKSTLLQSFTYVNKSRKVTYLIKREKNHSYQNKRHCFLKLWIHT